MGPTPDEMHALYCHALEQVTVLGPDGYSERVGPWLCIDAGIGVSRFNVAVAVELVSRPRDALNRALEWFAARGLNVRFDLRGTVDGGLLAACVASRLAFWGRRPSMVLQPLAATWPRERGTLEIRDVRSADDVARYCQVEREEFGDEEFQAALAARALALPGVRLHVGLLGERPVARAMSLNRRELVGVYNVYVAPSQRRRGFGGEMTMAAADAGRAGGATAACLESTEEAFGLYQELGFRRVDDYILMGTDEPVQL
ncbi:MAG: GNAT family N-acetyltransferase [Dehalococcoidia bacterium]|nr:GNAT family N-acetyltransferase [Dehalococcoidia bacterium]